MCRITSAFLLFVAMHLVCAGKLKRGADKLHELHKFHEQGTPFETTRDGHEDAHVDGGRHNHRRRVGRQQEVKDDEVYLSNVIEYLSNHKKDTLSELKTRNDWAGIQAKIRRWTLMERMGLTEISPEMTEKALANCHRWIRRVTSAEERETLRWLQLSDHEAAKLTVRRFVPRLPLAERKKVMERIGICEFLIDSIHKAHCSNLND